MNPMANERQRTNRAWLCEPLRIRPDYPITRRSRAWTAVARWAAAIPAAAYQILGMPHEGLARGVVGRGSQDPVRTEISAHDGGRGDGKGQLIQYSRRKPSRTTASSASACDRRSGALSKPGSKIVVAPKPLRFDEFALSVALPHRFARQQPLVGFRKGYGFDPAQPQVYVRKVVKQP